MMIKYTIKKCNGLIWMAGNQRAHPLFHPRKDRVGGLGAAKGILLGVVMEVMQLFRGQCGVDFGDMLAGHRPHFPLD